MSEVLRCWPTHPERGWPVDPGTGVVYGIAGRWAGRPIGTVEVVTSGENNLHACRTGLKVAHGVSGPGNWNYKVTPEMRSEILARLHSGETGKSIASSLDLSSATIHKIKRGHR